MPKIDPGPLAEKLSQQNALEWAVEADLDFQQLRKLVEQYIHEGQGVLPQAAGIALFQLGYEMRRAQEIQQGEELFAWMRSAKEKL
jgi:hypothetical protein